MKIWHLKNEAMNKSHFLTVENMRNQFQIMKRYLISVSSSTTRSHLVFGTALLTNLLRIANVFPQWPESRDMPSI